MALTGYARVSKDEQNLDLQLDALKRAGCVRIFTDKLTGTTFEERKKLQEALAYLNKGDTLIVWKLDRLGRSLKQLINTLETLRQREIKLISTMENIDTDTTMGKAFFYLVALFAEIERDMISDRTKAGLKAARARGRQGGRRKVDISKGKPMIALKMYDDDTTDIAEICKTLHISRATLFRWKKLREEQKNHDTPLPNNQTAQNNTQGDS